MSFAVRTQHLPPATNPDRPISAGRMNAPPVRDASAVSVPSSIRVFRNSIAVPLICTCPLSLPSTEPFRDAVTL